MGCRNYCSERGERETPGRLSKCYEHYCDIILISTLAVCLLNVAQLVCVEMNGKNVTHFRRISLFISITISEMLYWKWIILDDITK